MGGRPIEPVIQMLQVTRTYGFRRGVENLSFEVGRGEIFGCLGPNGAGKTTTIRLMLDFLAPDRGKVLLFGKRVRRGARHLRRAVGYCPGELGLYENRTGEQHLRLYGALGGSKTPLREWLCDALRFTRAERTRLVKSYSKGMRQKLGLVQAMQHDPDAIILDEPTGGLDPLVQCALFDVLRELKARGKTVFFSSHVLSEVYGLCDRAGVLMDGRLILCTPIADFVAAAGRLLWIRLPGPAGDIHPVVERAEFVRREAEWLVYRVLPPDFPGVLAELNRLQPLDFRFESAPDELFMRLYERPEQARTATDKHGRTRATQYAEHPPGGPGVPSD